MIYTAGYFGRDLSKFKATVGALGAMVIDIRLVPQSRFFPQWRQANLKREFGDDYLHVPQLGNNGFKEKRIEIADMEAGISIVENIYMKSTFVGVRPVILLCACKLYEKCHRKTVADELRQYCYQVEELEYV